MPYREACKKAGVECAFPAGRLANVSERVTFLVERVDDGIKVTIKGNQKPKRSSLQNRSINPSTRMLMNILKSILDLKKKSAIKAALFLPALRFRQAGPTVSEQSGNN